MGHVNERLRTAMMRTGVTSEDLAVCCGVDPKTVDRWISPGRVPHRTHRWAAARRLGCEESYLWPEVRRSPARRAEAAHPELVCLYPDRASVPREVWLRLMTDAAEHIDLLVFSGTFYAQTQPKVAAMLAAAAGRGCRVLLQRRRDTGQWAIPMGKQELGETPSQCAIRETLEETGVLTEITGILGVYSDPGHIVAYGDGEVRQEWELILLGRPIRGTPAANDEASDVGWFTPDELGALDIHPTQWRQLRHWLARTWPHID